MMKSKAVSVMLASTLMLGLASSTPAQYFSLETPKIYSPGEKAMVNLSSQGASGSIFGGT